MQRHLKIVMQRHLKTEKKNSVYFNISLSQFIAKIEQPSLVNGTIQIRSLAP